MFCTIVLYEYEAPLMIDPQIPDNEDHNSSEIPNHLFKYMYTLIPGP